MAKNIFKVASTIKEGETPDEMFHTAIAFLSSEEASDGIKITLSDAKTFLSTVEASLKTKSPIFYKAVLETAKQVSYSFEVAANEKLKDLASEIADRAQGANALAKSAKVWKSAITAATSLPSPKQDFEKEGKNDEIDWSVLAFNKLKAAQNPSEILAAIDTITLESPIRDDQAEAFLLRIKGACERVGATTSEQAQMLETLITHCSDRHALYNLTHDRIHALYTPEEEGRIPSPAEYGSRDVTPQ